MSMVSLAIHALGSATDIPHQANFQMILMLMLEIHGVPIHDSALKSFNNWLGGTSMQRCYTVQKDGDSTLWCGCSRSINYFQVTSLCLFLYNLIAPSGRSCTKSRSMIISIKCHVNKVTFELRLLHRSTHLSTIV